MKNKAISAAYCIASFVFLMLIVADAIDDLMHGQRILPSSFRLPLCLIYLCACELCDPYRRISAPAKLSELSRGE